MPVERVVNSRFRFVCTSLVPRPMIVVFGFGTRLHVRMAFIDQGEFEAMNSLSRWEAACCDEHHFRVKIKVSA